MSLILFAALPQNGTNVENDFKCEICLHSSRTADERNVHIILQHFQQMFCTFCEQTLIRIGDNWYGKHSDHNPIKTESNIDDCNEHSVEPTIISDFIAVNPTDDAQCREASNECDPILSTVECDNIVNPVDVFKTEKVALPDFIELKPVEIVHSENIDQNELNDTVGNHDEDKVNKSIAEEADNGGRKKLSKKRFQCASCDKKYAIRRNLMIHVKKCNHTMPSIHISMASESYKERSSNDAEVETWKCKQCNMDFKCESSFAEHVVAQHGKSSNISSVSTSSNCTGNISEMVQCAVEDALSDDSTTNIKNVADKIETRRKATTLICGVCNKQLSCPSGFKAHMNSHLGIKYKCEHCDRAFADKRHLNKHQKSHMPITHELNDYLQVDGVKLILTEQQLDTLTCPTCAKTFYTVTGLKCHIKVHETPKFQCKLCDKVFSDVNNYKRHRSISHTNVRPDEPQTVSIQNYDDVVTNSALAVDWICEYCNSDFEFEIRLAKHIIKEHNEDKPEHLCNICDSKFDQLNDLLMHMRAHPESVQHKCTIAGCEQGFAYKSSLMLHINKHNRLNGAAIQRKTQQQMTDITKHHATFKSLTDDSSLFTCEICNKTCPNRTGLLYHIQGVHSTIRLKCPISNCDRIFKTDNGIFGHMQKVHPEEIRECGTCGKSFFSEEKLAKHQLSHNRPKKASFICNECNKSFPTKSDLRTHLSTHEKQAECNICGEKFSSATIMLRHRERHGKKKVITCKFKGCNQIFENRREFFHHTSQHPDSEKKKFICSYCGKAMATLSYLRDHINTHTGNKPFKCDQCQKCFAKNGSLRRHVLIHTGVKPYHCDQKGCTQAYRDSIDLKRHKFSAHKIYTKKHICPICSKVFSERKLLTKHTASVHSSTSLQG